MEVELNTKLIHSRGVSSVKREVQRVRVSGEKRTTDSNVHSRGAPLYADVGAQRIKHPNTKSTRVVSRSPGALQCGRKKKSNQQPTTQTNRSKSMKNYLKCKP